MSIRRVIGSALVIIGLFVISLPWLMDLYYDHKNEQIMESYLKSVSLLAETEYDETDSPTDLSSNEVQVQSKLPVESILSIPKINLLMPVIKDATVQHLNISISSIHGTAKPWEKGNYVIAGHRSRSFGRHFNRLNELVIEDEIIVTDTNKNEYHYRVFDITIVDKSDVSVLESGDTNEITLITCDSIYEKNPPTRLIVKAKKVN